MTKSKSPPKSSKEALENEIKQQDGTFNADEARGNAHPYIKVMDHKLYPELKPIIRRNTVEYQVLDTHVNLAWMLGHFDAAVRYNMMTRMREVVLPGLLISVEDADNDALAKVEYLARLNEMPDKNVNQHLSTISHYNAYHPIRDLLLAHPWDRVRRLDDFTATLTTANPEFDRLLIKTWMRSAVAAAFSDSGFIQHGVLVIQGDQGVGKTEWVKKLNPGVENAVRLGAIIDPRSRDSLLTLARYWLVEIGELDGTFNRSDIAHLKSFITNDVDTLRMPYARRETQLPRRTAFVATVNHGKFLVDETGNRRWWTVEALEVDYRHDFNMVQVWAEAYQEWLKGELTYLPFDLQAQLNERNKGHELIDPLREKLMTWYDWEAPVKRYASTTEVLEELNIPKPTRSEATRCGIILKSLCNKEGRLLNGIWRHLMPHKLLRR